MKVFLSWSGELSRKVAIELRDWLPLVIQSLQPYVSSEDIDKGSRWSIDIAKELEDSLFGILCVTPDNLEAPWINFEAGALSKAFNNSNVSPLLFGLKPSDLKNSPLLQFQSTLYDKKDFLKLILSLNNALSKDKINEINLQKTFDIWWETIKEKLDMLLVETTSVHIEDVKPKKEKIQNEILEELLELTREQHKILRNPETILPVDYLLYIINKSSSSFSSSSVLLSDSVLTALENAYTDLRKFFDIASTLNTNTSLNFEEIERDLFIIENTIFLIVEKNKLEKMKK